VFNDGAFIAATRETSIGQPLHFRWQAIDRQGELVRKERKKGEEARGERRMGVEESSSIKLHHMAAVGGALGSGKCSLG
jgi:hypothetical protein